MQETKQKEEVETIIIDPIEEVKKLLFRLKKLKAQKDIECAELIQKFLDIQEQLNDKQQPFDSEAETIQSQIKALLLDIQKTIKTDNGQASYRKGSLRVSYDRVALDSILDENIKKAILPYRKETVTEPSIKVEVY